MLKPIVFTSSHSSQFRAEAAEWDGSEGGRQGDGLGFLSYLSVQQHLRWGHMMERVKCKHQGSFLCFCQHLLREKGQERRDWGWFWLFLSWRRDAVRRGSNRSRE